MQDRTVYDDENFDCIIVGSHIGGLLAAVALAKAGKKIFFVDTEKVESNIYERPSGSFLLDQNWEPIFGIYEGSKEDSFLKKLGVYQELSQLFPTLNPSLQLISRLGSIDFSYSNELLDHEWRREFPKFGKELSSLCRKITHEGNANKSFHPIVEGEGLEHQWSQIGEIHAPILGAVLPAQCSLSLVQFYFKEAAKGIRYLVGGRDAFREILFSKLRWYGGKIKKGGNVEEIVFENKKPVGVLLSSYEGFIKGKTIVGNMRAQKFAERISPSYSFPKIEKEIDFLQPSFWRYNFTIRVPEFVIPEGLAKHVCFHDFETDLLDGQFFQIFIAPKNSYSGLVNGQSTVIVRTLVPLQEKNFHPELISANIKRCIKRIEYFMPFICDEKIIVKPNPDCLLDDPIFHQFFSKINIADIPDHQIVYSANSVISPTDGINFDWSAYGTPGLFLSSRDVYPAQGFLGEVKTAMELCRVMLGEKS